MNTSKRIPIILNPISSVELEVLEERVVDEKKDEREIDIKAKWQHAGIININHRRYRKKLLEREIGKTMDLIQAGESVWGLGFHPKDGLGKPQDISHVWTKVWMNPDGVCEGNLTILPTTLGKEIQVIAKGGHRKLGISSRGFGTTTEKEEMIENKKIRFLDVNDDYAMKTPGDFVIAPSVEGAGNVTEEIYRLESELNEGLDFIVDGENTMDIKTLKELKEAYPEFTRQIKDEAKVDVVKEKEGEETKVADLEGQIAEKDTKIEKLETESKDLKEWKENTIDEIRDLISSISEIEGVIPEDTGDGGDAGDKGSKEAEAELTKSKEALLEAEKKVVKLETEKQEKEDKEKKAVEETKLQTDLRSKLDEILKKEEYKIYNELIEAELFKDNKIVVATVEGVDDAVKAVFEKISNTIAAAEKAKIVTAGIKQKGKIKNPEGGADQEAMQKRLEELYQEATGAGFKGTFDEWKEKYPQIVESVS